MSAGALVSIEQLGDIPAPPPARPRVLLVATALASAAVVMGFAGLLGVYLHERSATIAETGAWFDGNTVPLTPGNMSLVGFVLSVVFMHWAVEAIGRDDRRHTWLAFGAVLFVGVFHFVGTGFLYFTSHFEVATKQGALVYGLTGAHLALTGAGLLFAALMAFRTLGGQYSAKDREGVVAATVFWWAVALTYGVVWYAVYVTK